MTPVLETLLEGGRLQTEMIVADEDFTFSLNFCVFLSGSS